VVIEDTTLLSLEKTCLRGLIQSYPDMSIGILRSLSLRLRDVNQKLIKEKSHA
jgi:CRP-like cAMP-binding protein